MFYTFKSLFQINAVFKETFSRFPFVYVFIVLATFFALLNVHDIHYARKTFEYEVLTSLYFLLVAFTSLTLFFESIKLEKRFRLIISILTIILVDISVFYFSSSAIFLGLGILSSLFFVVFIFKCNSNDDFLYFNIKGFYAIVFALVSCGILALASNLIITSIQYLFEVKFHNKIFQDIIVFIFSFIFPIFILSNIEKKFDSYIQEVNFSKAIIFLVNNILLPFIFIYAVILYAYFIKIVFTLSLPKGNLSWMIICFCFLGITTRVLSLLIKQNESYLLKLFKKYFYGFLVLPLGFLYFAIIVRVSEYGFTQYRYAILFLALWFTFITFASLLKKEKFNLKHIFTSLFFLCLVASSSPINSTIVTASSQVKRFTNFLIENKLLIDEELVELEDKLSLEKRVELSSLSSYIVRDEYSLRLINPYFENSLLFKKAEDILKVLDVKYASAWELEKNKQSIPYDFFDLNKSVLSTKGYTNLIKTSIYKNKYEKLYYFKKDNKKHLEVKLEKGLVKVLIDKKVLSFDIKAHYDKLVKRGITKVNIENRSDAILEKKLRGRSFKIQINRMNSIIKDEKLEIDSIDIYLLF